MAAEQTRQYHGLIYVLNFISGAAALIYEICWVRALTPIVGTSHLAVATVVSIYMAGLGLGAILVGRYITTRRATIALYGFIELGIAAGALLSLGLCRYYPALYAPLAQAVAASAPAYTLLRIVFGAAALIVPTTLIGATLPVLSSVAGADARYVGMKVSLLYGLNTLGAVLGAAAAGFFLLPALSLTGTLLVAVAGSGFIGIVALLIRGSKSGAMAELPEADTTVAVEPGAGLRLALQLAYWSAAVSGFCALGYELLWTRMLTMVIGASVYGFTLILLAFLAGIGLGSCVWGLASRRRATVGGGDELTVRKSIGLLGFVQIAIGATALAVTAAMARLPAVAVFMQELLSGNAVAAGSGSLAANGLVAVVYLLVPCFLLGVAFPLAAEIQVWRRRLVGQAVGDILAVNTFGAIAGSVVSGFILIYFFGIERSLQLLVLVNIFYGIALLVGLKAKRSLLGGVAVAFAIVVSALALNPGQLRFWNPAFLATFRVAQLKVFSNSDMAKGLMEHSTVLYHGEGVEASVSSIYAGGVQSFLINGRPESSTSPGDRQCMLALGHLPMLLAKEPRSAFVLGIGSGMTIGALLAHPELQRVTVADIEPQVVGVARTFKRFNRNALASPKVRLHFNDGRNFLLGTRERFDVITADPIHPWFSGAGYLYTREYYQLAASRLNPGGVICQWLPFYELKESDLRSMVRTFRQSFRYTMLWLTHQDVQMIGSNEPLTLNVPELLRRMQSPDVAADLREAGMGNPDDLFGYFLMANAGIDQFGANGVVNTDDNMFLEFSAPRSIGDDTLMTSNLVALSRYRESIVPYLAMGVDDRQILENRWGWLLMAGQRVDDVHRKFLGRAPDFLDALTALEKTYPGFGRLAALHAEFLRITGVR